MKRLTITIEASAPDSDSLRALYAQVRHRVTGLLLEFRRDAKDGSAELRASLPKDAEERPEPEAAA